APEPELPAVSDTGAVAFLDGWLAVSPRINRLGLRGLLYAAEWAPRGLGLPARLRRLDTEQRAMALAAAETARSRRARQLVRILKDIACLSYYGDVDVMRRLGYDADANVRRARELRRREGRP
ncbi:MAG TPA: hypothetical protein VK486_14440, partial [Thermoleophilaceae bacterium]|nr:hypothetical protein [Thermoleophilaceae bacterium]